MAEFAYSAISKDGRHLEGILTAPSREEALAALKGQGSKPLLIKESTKSAGKKFKFGGKVKSHDLVIFTRELSTMVSAGVPLAGALDTLQSQVENKNFKNQLTQVVKDVEGGTALGDALAKHPSTFSPVYINMVRAGEAGGILDEIMKKLAAQQEKDAAIKAQVKSATTYPLVLLGITVLAFFILTGFVVPKIGAMVTNLGAPGSQLPIQTRAMLGVSNLIRSKYGILLLVGMIGGLIYANHWRKTAGGKPKFDTMILKVPILKTVIIKVAVARFARIFASLMAAGVTVLEALQVTSQAIGNHVIEQELLAAAKDVKNGKQLSQTLSQSRFFPPIVSQMLAVGEETGKTDEVLIKVADFYEEEVDTLVNSLSSILEPVMIVVMGGMVGLIAASVIGPITSLNQSIQG
jgi:type IV pilus assembly protein PilC